MARLELAELARMTDSALSLAAAPVPPLVFSEAEDEAAPTDRQAWAQVWSLCASVVFNPTWVPCLFAVEFSRHAHVAGASAGATSIC